MAENYDEVMENEVNENAEVEETEKVESPVVKVFKTAGIIGLGVLAVYGAVSAIKDGITLAKDVKAAGGIKAYKAQQQIEKEKKKEAKDEEN